MTGAPFFSVVIPVYNRADVFAMALQSVLDQTEQDFEIIVVDDGSTDDPKSAIDRYSDSRIRFLRQENKGGGAARNAGIDLARGRFIAFLDSDDWFLPTSSGDDASASRWHRGSRRLCAHDRRSRQRSHLHETAACDPRR